MMISRVDGCYGSSSLSPSDHDNFFLLHVNDRWCMCEYKSEKKEHGVSCWRFFF